MESHLFENLRYHSFYGLLHLHWMLKKQFKKNDFCIGGEVPTCMSMVLDLMFKKKC